MYMYMRIQVVRPDWDRWTSRAVSVPNPDPFKSQQRLGAGSMIY